MINQVNIFNGGYRPMMGGGCLPMPACCQNTIFSAPYPMPMPVPMMPMMPVPMMPMSDAMALGCGMGMLAGTPGALQFIGDGLSWGYNNIIKPVWNGVVKPAWNFVRNDILRPIGKGLRWIWDHTLGWVFKKVETAVDASNARRDAQAADDAADAADDADTGDDE